jgi:hypothetical protein
MSDLRTLLNKIRRSSSSQVTNAVFLAIPKPHGYGFSEYAIAGAYGTPIVFLPLVYDFSVG